MPKHILVISPDAVQNQQLCAGLLLQGYSCSTAQILARPSSFEVQAQLCILDLCLARSSDHNQWQAWLQDCIETHTACLALDSTTEPDASLMSELEPLCGILTNPQDHIMLANGIRNLLTLRKLTGQLEATRLQLNRYQEEHQDALRSAAHIQRSLIPTKQPSYKSLHYSWQYLPCKQVGGDLFNIVQLDEQTVMTYLVDVSGHGISSAMVTVSVHQSLSPHTGQLVKRPTEQAPFYTISSPRQVLQELEAEYPFERFEEFFTISYLLINSDTGQVRYSNAGHPPPLLLRSDGSVERLSAGGTVIGVGNLLGFEEGETCLNSGDRLFMYTDGITEHLGTTGELFGEARFIAQLLALSERPIEDVTRETLKVMRDFGGKTLPIDDVTLIGMEFRPRGWLWQHELEKDL